MEPTTKILKDPRFGEIEAKIDGNQWWFCVPDVALLKYGKKGRMGGSEYHELKPTKEFVRTNGRSKRQNKKTLFMTIDGVNHLACKSKGEDRTKMMEFLNWLKLMMMFEKLPRFEMPPLVLEEEKEQKPDIFSHIEQSQESIGKKLTELSFDLRKVIVEWQNCVEAGLKYKSDLSKYQAKGDPDKVKALRAENATLLFLLGEKDMQAKRGQYAYQNKKFPITNEEWHAPQEVAEYFGDMDACTVNKLLIDKGLQVKVDEPKWGQSNYKGIYSPFAEPISQTNYCENGKSKFYHLQWSTKGITYIIGLILYERGKETL